jgi:formylglycine-generating enzyme required for sulfatase activity
VGLLLRPPLLDQAETWAALRPAGAPPLTVDTESRIAAAKARTRWRWAQAAIYVLLVGIVLGLVAWINQSHIKDEWRYLTVTWPYERANVRPYVLSAAKEQALKPGDSFKECAQDCPEMVVVPAGSFTMGALSPFDQPQHAVTITKVFAVSKYEETFADWDACVIGGGCNGYRPNDQRWGRGDQPVINVNWDDAQQYVTWLSQVTGNAYRLLSEAEYEYLVRAGTTTVYPWGDDIKLNGQAMANCRGCGSKWDEQRPAPVGSFPPNKFGLYDMIGNVMEWPQDCVHNDHNGAPTDGSAWLVDNGGDCTNRIVRSGAFISPNPDMLRSASRTWFAVVNRGSYLGFRVMRALLAP